jgi:hypothetical protein
MVFCPSLHGGYNQRAQKKAPGYDGPGLRSAFLGSAVLRVLGSLAAGETKARQSESQ